MTSRKIGPYTIVGSLARGATSEVLKAIDEDVNRVVAIKLLSPEFVRNPEALERFERESRTVTRLHHPGVAAIHEAGVTLEGQPYLVMEYVDGRSLRELISNKTDLSFTQQLNLIIQAAEGLGAALSHSIIHRDIKPANLMVDRDWHLKVVDFGLAKIIGEDTYKSVAGSVMGTPRYMAPEIALGRTGDYRSDIYSLGATFYHLLTGRPPFDGDTPAAVMLQHVNSPLASPHLLNPHVPADICEIVLKAMAKDPTHRYQDYDELLSDLKAAKMGRLAREKSGRFEVGEIEKAAVRHAPAAEPVLSRPPSYMTEGKVTAAPRGDSYWTWRANKRLKAMGVLLAIGTAVLILAAWPTGREESGRGLRSIVGALVSRLTLWGEAPEDAYFNQYTTSLDKIQYLVLGVKEYVVATGRYPSSLEDLVERRIIVKTEFLDAWGGTIRFEPQTRLIRAAGPDGILGTGDDFVADENGRVLQRPAEPERLAVEKDTELRERGKK